MGRFPAGIFSASEFHSTDEKDEGYEGLKGFSNSFIRKTKNKYI